MTPVSTLVPKAAQFARKAHDGMGFLTACNYNRPQTEHLQEVADLIWASGGSEAEIAAAWLHDSVEDTPTTLNDIREEFGDEVAGLVHELTDSEEIRLLATAERKQKQAERISEKSESAKKIKLADQTSNVRCVTVDPKAEWTVDGRRNYVLGAKRIADQCKGLNAALDEAFDREYEKAVLALNLKPDSTQTQEALDKDC